MKSILRNKRQSTRGKISTNVILPELGEGITKATVACWHFKTADRVGKGDDIVELVTDKASFNVEAPSDGIIKEIFAPEGHEAQIGEVLAVIQ